MTYTKRNFILELFLKHPAVSTDTRKIKPGCIFFGLKGANFNGNEYALKAIEQGAAAAIIDDKSLANSPNLLLVEDVLLALQNLARDYRNTFNIPFIAITGTNGKTTTKELLYEVLNSHYHCYATEGNLNNHIGVPLTILRLKKEHEIAIIEMGANKPGDIKELCEIANPTHGIITNVGKAHLEGFGSFNGVKKTKGELYDFLKEKDEPVFINLDNHHLLEMAQALTNVHYYSISKTAAVIGTPINSGLFVNFKWKTNSFESNEVKSKLTGVYNLENIIAAVAIGCFFSVPEEKISSAISHYTPSNNRSQIKKTSANTLILDAYNANPTSTIAALKNLDQLEVENKLYILGDMLELGEISVEAHKEIIELCADLNLQGFFVGSEYKAAGAENCFLKNTDLIEYLRSNTIKHKTILIKGSRGIKLESVVEFL